MMWPGLAGLVDLAGSVHLMRFMDFADLVDMADSADFVDWAGQRPSKVARYKFRTAYGGVSRFAQVCGPIPVAVKAVWRPIATLVHSAS